MTKSNLEVVLRLTAKTSAASKQIDTFLSRTNNKFKGLEKIAHNLNEVGSRNLSRGAANMAKGAAALAPIVYFTNKAVELEAAVSDITKVLPNTVKVGSEAFNKLGNDAMEVGYKLAIASGEASGLMASLAAGGTAEGRLKKVALMSGEIGVAFEISGMQAGQAFQAMKNALQTTEDGVMRVMNANNALANSYGSTVDASAKILDFMMNGGASLASSLKISGSAMEALFNTLLVAGKDAKESGTALEAFGRAVLTNSKAAEIFNKAGGGTKGIIAMLEQAKASGNAVKWLIDHGVGRLSVGLSTLTSSLDSDKGFKKQLAFVNDDKNVTGSVDKEFAAKTATKKFQLAQLKVGAMNLATTLGSTLIPALTSLMKAAKPILDTFSKWAQANPKLLGGILKVFAASAALKIGVGALQFAFGGTIGMVGRMVTNLSRGAQMFKNATKAAKAYRAEMALAKQINAYAGDASKIGKLRTAFLSVGSAVSKVGVFMLTSPWMLAIAAIAAAAYLIYKNWDKISAWFKRLWNNVTKIFMTVVKVIAALLINFTPLGLIYKHWGAISGWFKRLWDGVKGYFSAAWEWIKNMFLNYTPYGLVIKNWEKIVDAFKVIWGKVKDVFTKAMDWIKNSWVGKIIGKLIGGIGDAWGRMKSVVDYASKNDLGATVRYTTDQANQMGITTFMNPAPSPKLSPYRSGNTYSNPFNLSVSVSAPATQADADLIVRTVKKNMKGIMADHQHNLSRTGFGILNPGY